MSQANFIYSIKYAENCIRQTLVRGCRAELCIVYDNVVGNTFARANVETLKRRKELAGDLWPIT